MGSLPSVIASRKSRAAAGSVAIATCLALLGCGEKSEPPTTGKVVEQSTTTQTTTTEQQQEADRMAAGTAASAFLTSTEAARVCDSGITPALLEKQYGNRAGCIADRKPSKLAQKAVIAPAKIGAAGTATVMATATGGDYGKGEKLTLSVVRDGTGTWRVDMVKSS